MREARDVSGLTQLAGRMTELLCTFDGITTQSLASQGESEATIAKVRFQRGVAVTSATKYSRWIGEGLQALKKELEKENRRLRDFATTAGTSNVNAALGSAFNSRGRRNSGGGGEEKKSQGLAQPRESAQANRLQDFLARQPQAGGGATVEEGEDAEMSFDGVERRGSKRARHAGTAASSKRRKVEAANEEVQRELLRQRLEKHEEEAVKLRAQQQRLEEEKAGEIAQLKKELADKEKEGEAAECAICMDAKADCALPCGHKCVCRECAPLLVGYHDIPLPRGDSDLKIVLVAGQRPLRDAQLAATGPGPAIASTFARGQGPEIVFANSTSAPISVAVGIGKHTYERQKIEPGWNFVLLEGDNTPENPLRPLRSVTERLGGSLALNLRIPGAVSGIRVFPVNREGALLLPASAPQRQECPMCRAPVTGSAIQIFD